MTRAVEARFRYLKSDLNNIHNFHNKETYIESHIWLGILAYQVVNYITLALKEQGIRYSWKTIVEKLRAQRITTTTTGVKGDKKGYIKTCTSPITDAKQVYTALNLKSVPLLEKQK